jgi:hypothetical protein
MKKIAKAPMVIKKFNSASFGKLARVQGKDRIQAPNNIHSQIKAIPFLSRKLMYAKYRKRIPCTRHKHLTKVFFLPFKL